MKISEINIYPVKSLKGIALTEAKVEERGLENDRRWMLTDEKGMFFTQREFSLMAGVKCNLGDNGCNFSAPGARDLEITLKPADPKKMTVTVWGSECDAHIYNDEVNSWFSDVLGVKCQLAYMPVESRREINSLFNKGNEVVSFADGYPLLVIGASSLVDLNSRLEEKLPMNRFRPNIVVEGAEAYAEDHWTRIRIGDSIFRSTKPCARCVMTTIDQEAAAFDGKEPLKTLAEYRKAKDVIPKTFESFGMDKNNILFGQNLVPETTGGIIRLGDAVEILE